MRDDEIKEVKRSIKEKIYGKDFNKNRSRYYGLRVGDIVQRDMYGNDEKKYKVIQYGFGDNNRIYLKAPTGEIIKEVAEWCTIISKVEEIKK